MGEELRRFNWGGFLLGWVWAFGHRLWLWGALGLIPLVSVVVQLVLGFRGNRIAWENGSYESEEELRRKERVWAWAAVCVWLGVLVFLLVISFAGAGVRWPQ